MNSGRFSLCAQDERPPYKYVTVEGPFVIEDASDAERLELARRYLGARRATPSWRPTPAAARS